MNSLLLVVIQFSMIAMIVAVGKFPDTIVTMVLFTAGIILGITSILFMRLDNLRIFPEPKKDIRLVTTGPYRILRHPMYTSVLLFAASFIADSPSYFPYILWFILLCVLMGKIYIEERLLPQHLPEYADYKKRTWRLIPFIY
ncbi:MAG: isoprenylcysteine carboxylmethyltransferase family protein [Ignavibacteriales bacterium]|nr:isoprenylcysteine carboxylmethyltransferase family protein [Ignavibacteriales bacterium]